MYVHAHVQYNTATLLIIGSPNIGTNLVDTTIGSIEPGGLGGLIGSTRNLLLIRAEPVCIRGPGGAYEQNISRFLRPRNPGG